MYDLVIRGGTVVDGTGAGRFEADVAIQGGRIADIGHVRERGRDEIDARDLLVTPGFIDIHTHYDGQVTWDPVLSPSSWHGVTTVVMGNCGVGFAPVESDRREWLIGLMEGVEDIPGSVLAEGIVWDWESFPEYLDAIDTPHAIDFAAQVPHDALRTYVMGERGADHEARATDEDIAAMRALVAQAIGYGALGWSTGRTSVHRTSEGVPTPGVTASTEEILGLASGMRDAGAGVVDIVTESIGDPDELALVRRIAEEGGRPISVSVLQYEAGDAWREWLDAFEKITERTGVPVRGQVSPRALGVMLGWELSWHPFVAHPTYRTLAALPTAARIVRLREPAVRRAILAETPDTTDPKLLRVARAYDRMFELGDPPDYEPEPSASLATRAARLGRSPAEVAYDAMMAHDGAGLLYLPLVNFARGDLEDAREWLARDNTVVGLGDAGAHCGTICDASFPTTMLTHWGRDRRRGPRFDVEWLVKRQTLDQAVAMGLGDRGALRRGLRGDVNLIDMDSLALRPPTVVRDLPAGGRRLVQRATGYRATVVAGQVVMRDGEHTGVLPGRLVRGALAGAGRARP